MSLLNPPPRSRASRRPFWILLAALGLALAVLPAVVQAGTITGTVRAQGPQELGGEGGGAYQSRRYRFLERVDYDALRDFVVHVTEVPAPPAAGRPMPRATVLQRDGEFVPRVLPIMVGTEVDWPNADDIYHNVFSISDTTPFDLGLYKRGAEAKKLVFDRVGRVDVFCSIHAQMSCVVLVLPNPWFATTDARGRFVLHDVPAGTYRVRAWHERLPAQVHEVTVPEQGEVAVEFVLSIGAPPRD